MTDQELKDLVASLAIGNKELREAQLKTDEQMRQMQMQMQQSQAKTDEQIKRVSKDLGNIGNSQGMIAEEFFYNSLAHTQTLAGIHYDFIDKNMTRRAGSVEDEFDIVMINGKDVAIIEVKYKAREADLTRLITKKYENFKKLFPMYKNYKHHLVLATFGLYDDLKEKALAQGVTLLQRKGDLIESFEPA